MKRSSLPITPILYFVISLAICLLYVANFGARFFQIVGLVLIIISFSLWIVARVQLGEAFSLRPKSTQLVTSGLYAKIRHPIYVFSVLALLGLAAFFESPVLIAATALLAILEYTRKTKEEELLAKTFGKKYMAYKNQTWF